jgi:exopolysaccharide production protein ExoQ
MVVRVQTLRMWFAAMVLFYYSGFMSFFSALLSGRGEVAHGEVVDAATSGNVLRQLLGLGILGLGSFFLLRLQDRSLASFAYKHIFWLLLLGFVMASVAWSVAPDVSVRRMLALLIVFVAALVMLYEFPPEVALAMIARIIGWAAVVGLGYALIFPGQAFIQGEGLRSGAFLGIFNDKNAGARSYVYALIIVFALRLFYRRTDRLLLAALVLAILMSSSATAIAMSVAGIGLVWVFNQSRVQGNPQRTFNRLILVSLGITAAAVIGNIAYDEILLLLGRDPSLTNRTIIWEMLAVNMQQKPLLGFGFGAFWASQYMQDFVEAWGFIGNAHSSYMEMRLIGGYCGLAVLCAAFAGSFVRSLKGFTYYPDSPVFALAAAILLVQAGVSYIAFIVPNHVSFDMFVFALMAIVGGRFGLQKPVQSEAGKSASVPDQGNQLTDCPVLQSSVARSHHRGIS